MWRNSGPKLQQLKLYMRYAGICYSYNYIKTIQNLNVSFDVMIPFSVCLCVCVFCASVSECDFVPVELVCVCVPING